MRPRPPSETAASASPWGISSMWQICRRDRPWPVAHRPFEGEAFGSWFGRMASRYRLTVDELASSAGVTEIFADEQLSWLEVPAPRGGDCEVLARLARVSNEIIAALGPQGPLPSRQDLPFCHSCLFLNPLDVRAPSWPAGWLHGHEFVCSEHPGESSWVGRSTLRKHRNMGRLLSYLSRRRQAANRHRHLDCRVPRRR